MNRFSASGRRAIALVAAIALSLATATAAAQTSLRVDGTIDDWAGREILHTDRSGDAASGCLDLTTGYAFCNADALYFFVEVADPTQRFVQLDVIIEADGAVHLFSWPYGQGFLNHAIITTGFQYAGPATASAIAFRHGFEGRIDLEDLCSPRFATRIREINVIADRGGEVDTVDSFRPTAMPPRVPEEDAALPPTSGERPCHIATLDPALVADYRYRGPIQVPIGVAYGAGHLYVADQLGKRIVCVDPQGGIDGLDTWCDTAAWHAMGPMDVTFDAAGTLYVSNMLNIYAVEPGGGLRLLEGTTGHYVDGIAFDDQDVLYFSDSMDQSVLRVGADNAPHRVADGIPSAFDLAFGADGTLYVSQHGEARIVRVDPATGRVEELFSSPDLGFDQLYLAVDPDGDLWVRGFYSLVQLRPDGTLRPFTVDGQDYDGIMWWEGLGTSGGIDFDDEGRLWIASYNSSIRVLEPADRPPSGRAPELALRLVAAGFQPVQDMDIDEAGNLYVYNNNPEPGELVKIHPDGQIEVLLPIEHGGGFGVAVDDRGRLFVGLPTGEIVRIDSGGRLQHHAWVRSLNMSFGSDGALYAASGDRGERKTVVRIAGVDRVTTFLEALDGQPLGNETVQVDPAPGGLYVCDEQRRTVHFVGFDGDSRLLTVLPGGGPIALTSSPQGELYAVPCGGPPYGYSLLRIAPSGAWEILATGLFGDPLAAAVSRDGDWLYVAENGAIDRLRIHADD